MQEGEGEKCVMLDVYVGNVILMKESGKYRNEKLVGV